MVKRTQLTKLVYERNQGANISMSAIKAGMSRTTARNYLRQDDVMEQRQAPHSWRTRADPLEAVWPQALAMLREAPELEAKALFEYLAQTVPGGVKAGLLRTFQRRVRQWRLAEGPEKEVFFTQDHKPGEVLAAMRETAIEDLPDYRELMVSVGNNSTIRVRKLRYSVPSRLIGTKLLARIYENRIVLLAGAQEVAQLPLNGGDRGAVIDFRHVIGHLLRKPGAFAGYRWREEMFPAQAFRAAYDHLTRTSAQADRRYLEILKVAADEGQTVVENALEQLLGAPHPVISDKEVLAMIHTWRDLQQQWRERPPLAVCLKTSDILIRLRRTLDLS